MPPVVFGKDCLIIDEVEKIDPLVHPNIEYAPEEEIAEYKSG
jgi:hypothetical protein